HESRTTSRPMPASASRASLMDDLDFVGELEKFDAEPSARASVAAHGLSPDALLDALDDVWEPRATFYEPAREVAAGAHASAPAHAAASPPPSRRVRQRQPDRELEPQPVIDYAQALVVEE